MFAIIHPDHVQIEWWISYAAKPVSTNSRATEIERLHLAAARQWCRLKADVHGTWKPCTDWLLWPIKSPVVSQMWQNSYSGSP